MHRNAPDDTINFETLESNIPSRPISDIVLHTAIVVVLFVCMINLLISSLSIDGFSALLWLAIALNGVNMSYSAKQVKTHYDLRRLYLKILRVYPAVDRSAHEQLQQSLTPWKLHFWRHVQTWLAQERKALDASAERAQRFFGHQ